MQNRSAQSAGCTRTTLNGSIGIRTGIETHDMAIGCQRIETGNSAGITGTGTIISADQAPLRHAGKNPAGRAGTYRSGLEHYRRQRAFVMREVPLSMLPAAIRRGVKEKGGKMYRAVIIRTHWNHYTVTIRCSTKKATGHPSSLRRRDRTLLTYCTGEGDADG